MKNLAIFWPVFFKKESLMSVKNLNHPIVVGEFSCKIAGITHNTKLF